jgi:tetracycline 7-halogenase / FADH2 O2-dependent halogenase
VKREKCDIVVLGAGFAGSLISLIAKRAGRRVVLLEKGSHPRFAIGESSTPLANLKLEQLCRRYSLTEFESLTKYGSWKRHHPDIACGLKRGFSFFRHEINEPFQQYPDHRNELLVEANPDTERADTHWYRADFDAFAVKQAAKGRVAYYDRFHTESIEHDSGWRIVGQREGAEIEIIADFAVDATGPAASLARTVTGAAPLDGFHTASRSIFGHFRNVTPWQACITTTTDHPFPCDAAALHHVIDGGWMWVLRFDNGVTSAGFSLDTTRHPLDTNRSAEDEWSALLASYPSIQHQFAHATPVTDLIRTTRQQRRLQTAAGEDWAALPHAACFVDPWLSPGIAFTMYGLDRLARILTDSWSSPDRADRLTAYSDAVFREASLVDRITSTCFANLDRFEVLAATTMLYFAAAIFSEEAIRTGTAADDDEFLLAHDDRFLTIVDKVCEASRRPDISPQTLSEMVRNLIAPYNSAGLCDPMRSNMYPFTGTIG